MLELQIFKNEEFGQVRTAEINGKPYFVGKDVAEILGYTNPSKAVLSHVDAEDKQFIMIDIADTQNGNVPIGQSKTAVINESGLYSLIFSSKLASAKRFKHWVTSEVLPTIRKHGVYAIDEVLNNPDMMIAVLTELKNEREKVQSLTEMMAVQEQQIMELQPKASYYDVVLNCPDLLSVTEIAKDFGKTANWLNNFLKEQKIQFKQGEIWFLYKKYAEKGYTSTKTHTINGTGGKVHSKVHTYWTQKGRLFIYELLKSNKILPIIEQE